MEKFSGLIILAMLILSGCSSAGSKMITEENAPANADSFNQGEVMTRINELRMEKSR